MSYFLFLIMIFGWCWGPSKYKDTTIDSNATMGNSTSSYNSSNLAKERAYIRSLGDRFPFGDAELRRHVWCYQQLAARTPLPVDDGGSLLRSLAIWSAVYGDYNPYSKNTSELSTFVDPLPSVRKLIEALAVIERDILLPGLGKQIIDIALGLDVSRQSQTSSNAKHNIPHQLSPEEVISWQSTYFSIMVEQEGADLLQIFLEGISTSCGRRGSRSALTKLFSLSCKNGSQTANASDVIHIAYSLTLAASYLKNIASDPPHIDITSFIPKKSDSRSKSMVESLIKSAEKQRQSSGGFAGNFGYSFSSSSGNASNIDSGDISLQEFLEWAETTVPMISSALPTFLHALLSYFSVLSVPKKEDNKGPRFPPGVTPLWIPTLTVETKESTFSTASSAFVDPSTSMFELFALSCTSLSLASGRWHRLFSSEANGLSCNRLMHSILGFGGPTLILIRAKYGLGTFGAYTHTAWSHESGSFYGKSDCFLFRLGPASLSIYRPTGGNSAGSSIGMEESGAKSATSNNETDETRNFQYFNPEARSKGYDGLAHGIGFGGSPEQPRLYIDEVLDGSCARADDLTFENGPLLSESTASNGQFEVETIEVWGVGNSQQIEDALFARDGQRDDAAKRIRQAMKGAKGQFLEDFQSGLAGSKMFQHRDQIRGRDGGCDLDESREQKGKS